ncbi:MAG: oligosaccharide flippase family protein, partial [Acidobacteria bacterium]|nr:oligosaccharide flippase family protein [Acidobacteriota bacterium]
MKAEEAPARILRSAGAAALSQVWRIGVTFGVALVLRRNVPPADYGLWDWTFAVFMILGAIRDLGLPAHVLRLPNRPFGNLLWVECVWGGVLTAFAFWGAPLLALLFKDSDPRLVSVIRAMAAFLILEGLAQVALVYFEGELAIGRSLLPEVLRNLTFATVAFVLASLDRGVWSLVGGQLAASAVFAATLWIRAWGKIPL